MNVKRIMRTRRRAVSAVVTTIFLFAIILGAIAVSLGIVFPQVQTINDQIDVETAGTTLIALDKDIQTLVLNGLNSKIFKNIELSSSGQIRVDQTSNITLTLFEGPAISSNYSILHPRLQIVNFLDQDVIDEGTHRYLQGGGDQNVFFLNTTNNNKVPWSILNQSRAVASDEVVSSLSYRNIAKSDLAIDATKLQVNFTIELQTINMSLGSTDIANGQSFQISIEYLGSDTIILPWVQFNDDLIFRTSTLLNDPNSSNAIEYPLRGEKPVEDTTSYFVRLKIVYHQLLVTL